MRYPLLAIGFAIMCSNVVMGSALMNKERNAQIEKKILRKANKSNFDISCLGQEEKEWIYETALLKSLESLRKQDLYSSEDASSLLDDLAQFYNYKKQPHLATQRYIEKAEQDLENALNDNEAVLSMFNNLRIQQLLKDDFFKSLIKLYSKNTDNFVTGTYKNLEQGEEFKNHVASLAKTYQLSGQKTLETRIKMGILPIPLYNDSLASHLQNIIKADN
jgi:hypothetical protein